MPVSCWHHAWFARADNDNPRLIKRQENSRGYMKLTPFVFVWTIRSQLVRFGCLEKFHNEKSILELFVPDRQPPLLRQCPDRGPAHDRRYKLHQQPLPWLQNALGVLQGQLPTRTGSASSLTSGTSCGASCRWGFLNFSVHSHCHTDDKIDRTPSSRSPLPSPHEAVELLDIVEN